MISVIQNLRIGVKLAITSALSMLLVGIMIFVQMSGNATVRQADKTAGSQQALAIRALETKASVRGMMIGVRDIRLASKSDELQAAQDYLDARHKAAKQNAGETLKLSKSPENHARIEKMNALIDDYVNRAAREIITIQKSAVEIESKRSANGDLVAELEERLVKLHADEARLAREIGLPIAKELEDLANKVVEFAKHRVEEELAVAEREMSAAEHNSMGSASSWRCS